MKKFIYLLMIVSLVSLMAVGCGSNPSTETTATSEETDMKVAELVKDMALLDRAYIPAVAMTKQEKEGPSKKSIAMLNSQWGEFYEKYYNFNPADTNWTKDFDEITTVINEAETLINEGSLAEAHEVLEKTFALRKKLRERNDIYYYLDVLDQFHWSMETIIHSVLDRTPEDISDDKLPMLENFLANAKENLAAIKNAEMDNTIFNLPEKKLAQIPTLIAAEEESLNAFEQALKNGDKEAIIKTGLAVKPNYAKLFTLFGDMEKVKQ